MIADSNYGLQVVQLREDPRDPQLCTRSYLLEVDVVR